MGSRKGKRRRSLRHRDKAILKKLNKENDPRVMELEIERFSDKLGPYVQIIYVLKKERNEKTRTEGRGRGSATSKPRVKDLQGLRKALKERKGSNIKLSPPSLHRKPRVKRKTLKTQTLH